MTAAGQAPCGLPCISLGTVVQVPRFGGLGFIGAAWRRRASSCLTGHLLKPQIGKRHALLFYLVVTLESGLV